MSPDCDCECDLGEITVSGAVRGFAELGITFGKRMRGRYFFGVRIYGGARGQIQLDFTYNKCTRKVDGKLKGYLGGYIGGEVGGWVKVGKKYGIFGGVRGMLRINVSCVCGCDTCECELYPDIQARWYVKLSIWFVTLSYGGEVKPRVPGIPFTAPSPFGVFCE